MKLPSKLAGRLVRLLKNPVVIDNPLSRATAIGSTIALISGVSAWMMGGSTLAISLTTVTGLLSPPLSWLPAYLLNMATTHSRLKKLQTLARTTTLTAPPICITATLLNAATRTYLRKNPYLSISFLCLIDPTLATSYELLAGLLKKPLPGFSYTGRITETSTLAAGAIAAFISNNPEAILVSSGSSAIIIFLLMVLIHGVHNEATGKTFRGTTKRKNSLPTTTAETQGSSYNTISNSLLRIMQTAEASSQLAAFMATVKLLIHYCDLNKLPIIIAGQLWLTNILFTHGIFSKNPQQHIIDDEEASLPATPQPSGNEGTALLRTAPPSYGTQPQRKQTFVGAVGSFIPQWLKDRPAQRGHNFGPARNHDASFSDPLPESLTSIPTPATMPPASILTSFEEEQIASDESNASDSEENHVQILFLEK